MSREVPTEPHAITATDRKQIEAIALVDTKTLRRYLRGESVRSSTIARIEVAMAKLGITPRVSP